jgi:hypothetical protein
MYFFPQRFTVFATAAKAYGQSQREVIIQRVVFIFFVALDRYKTIYNRPSYRLEVREGLAEEDGLGEHARDGKHSKAAVLKLLLLEVLLDLGGLAGGELEGVEAEVAGGAARALVHLNDSLGADDLGEVNPEEDLDKGTGLHTSIVGEGGGDTEDGVVDIADDETKSGKHGNAAVLELSLLDPADVDVIRKSEGIEAYNKQNFGKVIANIFKK